MGESKCHATARATKAVPIADCWMELNHPQRSLGGGSAGAAVSVSAGFAFVAFATDHDGEISHAASRQGLYSLKLGLGSGSGKPEGCWQLSSKLDSLGAMARSARDLAAATEIMIGFKFRDVDAI